MSKSKGTYSGAVLRLAAAERLAAQADPAAEARRREASFLGNMRAAKADFDWIVAHEAWAQLGHATFAEWWDARVMPIAAGLGMRPTREIAKVVIERVVEEQKDLPKAQQRSQRDIAAMVGMSQKSVSRSLTESNDSGADLEEPAVAQTEPPADPAAAMHAALEDIDAHLAGQHTEDHTDEENAAVVPADSSAPSDVPGVASDGAPAEREEPPQAPPPADERPQGETGVASPAVAPQPAADEQSDDSAWKSKAARAAALRRDLHGFMAEGWKVIDQIPPAEIAPSLKPQVIEDITRFREQIDAYLGAIVTHHRQQFARPYLVREA